MTDAEIASHFEASKEHLPDPREAEDQVRAHRPADASGSARRCRRRTCSATTRTTSSSTRRPSRCARATSCFKTEGKDDAAVKKQAEELLAQGQGRGRFRGAREEALRGRSQRGQGRRPRLLQPRRDGQGVRRRGVRAQARRDRATSSRRSSATTSSRRGEKKPATTRTLDEVARADRGDPEVRAGAEGSRAHRRPSSPAS